MTKRQRKQRGRAAGKATRQQHELASTGIPSAQTFFRIMQGDRQTHATLRKATSALKPVLWLRDREQVALIKQAKTPAALIQLAPMATGLAEATWEDRMRRLGPEVLPLIEAQLKNLRALRNEDDQTAMVEKLLADLRWRGDAGAKVVLDCFDALDDYGRSIACVVLGLLGAQAGADRIWSFYQKVERNQRETYFVGALWGLIDLKDERADRALADLLHRKRAFYELFGFLSLAGDQRAIIPLMEKIVQTPEDDRYDPWMALAGIGHRMGRDALLAVLGSLAPPGVDDHDERAAIVDKILSVPMSAVEECFELFYRGITPADMAEVFGE